MEKLARFVEGEGKDASELDEAVADYMVQLASEGGTEEEVWSVLEGCFPELEEVGAPKFKRDFSPVGPASIFFYSVVYILQTKHGVTLADLEIMATL